MLTDIWQYKVQITPIIVLFIIFEVPALIRRLKKTFYVPIYFSVFPFSKINQDLSAYLGEDYFLCEGTDLSPSEAEVLRKRVVLISVLSAAIDALAVPLTVGFLAALFVEETAFYQFVVILSIYKVITILLSLRNSELHIIDSKFKGTLLSFVYIVYLGIVVEMLRTSYSWAVPFVTSSDWSGLLSSLSAFVFGKVFAQGLLFAFLVAIFANVIADRKLRSQNVGSDEQGR